MSGRLDGRTREVVGAMSKTVAKQESGLGIKVSGSDGNQKITVNDENTLKVIFGTDLPPLAEGLLSPCIKVQKGNEASDD